MKFLSVGSLALLQIAIVGNLQVLPTNASLGALLPFLYLVALIGFFIPCLLMTAELSTTHPQTGGAYIWCEKAFGAKVGLFTTTILWVSNLLWYPSIFLFIAANFAYLFQPELAHNKYFIISTAIGLFWFLTLLNCIGIKFSTRTSIACSVIGIIIPMLLIILGGLVKVVDYSGLAITFDKSTMLPDTAHLNVGLLIAIVISLFGIEVTSVHAGNVANPKRDYPKSLFISSVTLFILLLLSELAIAIVIPPEKLSILTGLLDALVILFHTLQLSYGLMLILALVLLGNIGSITAWMLGSTRGMYIACQKNHVASYFQKTNRHEAPIGVLLFEALLFTLISGIFLIFPNITDSFWLLMDLASQVTLVYYIILFCSAIRLRYLPKQAEGFVTPGGKGFWWMIMLLGILTSSAAFLAGFVAPDSLASPYIFYFHLIMGSGLLISFLIPLIVLRFR